MNIHMNKICSWIFMNMPLYQTVSKKTKTNEMKDRQLPQITQSKKARFQDQDFQQNRKTGLLWQETGWPNRRWWRWLSLRWRTRILAWDEDHPPRSSTEIIHRDHPPRSSTEIIHRDHPPRSSSEIIHRDHPPRSSTAANACPWT